jgi:hypothetical protein
MRRAAAGLAQAALERVQDTATRRVRVEDYLTVLAAMTGEAAIIASGIDIESAAMAPGSGLFGDVINARLTGDTADLAAVPPDTVLGVLLTELVPGIVDRKAFGSIEELYRRVAAGVGSTPWGAVPLDVPEDNRPTVLPIQVAFELRPSVDAAMVALRAGAGERHLLCALALAEAITQTRGAIDATIGLQLALQVVFGTAKMVPMSNRAFRAAQSEDQR